MSLFYRRPGIVNVRMVITEEKILSNIDKIQKLINPNSKKQIVQLDDDAYFKDLINSIKTYLIEYPKKKNFPPAVYKAAYSLVEYATNQFEDNTRKIEELIVQREKNIELSVKLINARISNLETNLHIEIDMERIEDRSKALSFIGIEIADALKRIPTPIEEIVVAEEKTEQEQYIEQTTFEVKPSLWNRIKQSKIARAISYVLKIRIKLELPAALPEGRGE